MPLLLAFAVMLVLAVSLSGLAHRSILSLAAIFLVGGFLAGPSLLALGDARSGPLLAAVAEVALFVVLFTDGLRLPLQELVASRRLPGRALLLGAPLALGATIVLGHLLIGLTWTQAFLVAAVLAPTDPVFASALVGRREVPERLRRLLNVESGLNDGLALPVVIVGLDLLGSETSSALELVLEVAGGVALGLAIPWVLRRVTTLEALHVAPRYLAVEPIASALLLFSLAHLVGANVFLAAFIGGITMRSVHPDVEEGGFGVIGEVSSELVKLGATFVFGVSLSAATFAEVPAGAYPFALLVLVAVRPVTVSVAMIGSALDGRERLAAAWFGPKGFASIVYALLVRGSGVPDADLVFRVVAIAVVLSILLHSSTDVLVAGRFERRRAHAGSATAASADRHGTGRRRRATESTAGEFPGAPRG